MVTTPASMAPSEGAAKGVVRFPLHREAVVGVCRSQPYTSLVAGLDRFLGERPIHRGN